MAGSGAGAGTGDGGIGIRGNPCSYEPRPVVAAFLSLTAGLRRRYGMVGLLPVFAPDRFQVGEAGVGTVYLAQGLGAVAGPLLGRRLTSGSERRRLHVAAGALAVFGLGYLALAQVHHLGWGMVAAFVGHVGVGACAILKVAYVHRHTFRTRAEARIRIATWITDFYNTLRLHSVCDYKSPIDYEREYRADLTVELAA